jgi:non-ribosomal peptide synthetase component F
MAVELQNSIESRLGVDVQMTSLLQGIDISTLASNILNGLKEDGATKVPVISSSQNASAEASLSSGQHRLWFLDQLEPGDPSYNIAVAVRLDGALSFPALEQALNEVMARHEGLRTQFKSLNGEPVQVITAVPTGQILQADLRHLGSRDAQAEALKLAAQESLRSFNLSRAPLFRLTLLRLSDESHTLLLTLPHIIGDGWSVNIFLRELAAIYTDYLAGTPSSLERLAIQYRDFVRWQKDRLRDEVIQAQLSYWKKKLASLRPAIPLPTDHPRPSRTSLRGACHWISLSQEISASLKEVSNREGATLFMTLLATLNILLCRYTRCFDITVGSPIAGRNRSEFEKLIGFFVNTLVLRNDLSGNPEFRELLSRVRKTALEAYDNQDTPFHRLVAEVVPERDLALAPLYRVWFVLQVSQSSVPVFSGLSLSPIDMELQATKFDLALNLTETPQGIKGSFEYSPDLFNKSTIQRMAEDYETLLKLVVSKPEARLDELLDHIDEKDRRQRQLRRETHERSSKEKLRNMKRRVVTRR